MKLNWDRIVVLCFVFCVVGTASAAPTVGGVFNAASWTPAGLPGNGIARGSMFVITGAGMGPEELFFPGTLPLSTEMAGTSISVTVAGVTESAFMVYTWTSQLAAVLPSSMPAGNGTFTITYNGETSEAFPILVVEHTFGIFTRNQSGYGPAILQNWHSPVDVRLNGFTEAAFTDQYEILWGTGLGAINGDDSTTPPIGNLDVNVEVLVGGIPAVVQYKGRSSEFPGVDQIQFLVPPGVDGCLVSVVVIVNGVVSNSGTMAIHSGGGACADRVTFQQSDLARTAQGMDTGVGSIVLLGVQISAPGQDPANILLGSAKFGSYTASSVLQSLGPMGFATNLLPASVGSCFQYHGYGDGIEFDDRAPATLLDAGAAIHMTAPAPLGAANLELDGGSYLIEDDSGVTVVPGMYTFDNGSGGAGVGPFETSLSIPNTQFTWTNKNAIVSVNRSQGLNITWTGGDDDSEVVLILGHSNRTDLGLIGAFMCMERISAHQFTVPVSTLSTLPASSPWNGDGDPTSGLIIGRMSRLDRNRFTAVGLDAGYMFYILADYRVVPVN